MAQVINTNIMSLNAQRNLNTSGASLATSIQRLSSGLRINSAKDDAAGLAISERFTTQIRGLDVAARNANDGISLAQTAEGAMTEIGNNLQRIRELAVQSANATNSASDRKALQAEVAQLVSEIDRVATQTDFNGTKLLDGSFETQIFQIGANAGQTIAIDGIANARTSALGMYTGFSVQGQAVGTSATATPTTISLGAGHSVALGTLDNDAKAMVAALNNAGIAGLTAKADATQVGSVATNASNVTAPGTTTLTVNNVAITVQATGNAATNRANAMAAINAQSAVTGVVATDDGQGLKLTAADGRNINTAFADTDTTGADMASFGLAVAGTTRSTYSIDYAGVALGTDNIIAIGGQADVPAGTVVGSTGTAMSAVDISTVAGASKALNAVDAALNSINSSRADLGAMQNRFTSTIANLQTTSENLSASRSRIRDADYAKETAELTRTQILQQAGTAMLAQANSSTQSVLSLLQQ